MNDRAPPGQKGLGARPFKQSVARHPPKNVWLVDVVGTVIVPCIEPLGRWIQSAGEVVRCVSAVARAVGTYDSGMA